MMKLCGANTAVLWLVMSLIFSGCDADHTTRDGMLEKMLEQLQQQNQEIERQNEQLALHSEQNSQIVRHLAELAEQLQEVNRVAGENSNECVNADILRQELTRITEAKCNTTQGTSIVTSTPPLVPGADCGRLLSPVPASVMRAPDGWVLCHQTDPEPDLASTECQDLLVGLRGGLNAESLMESGGNFGCWRTHNGPAGIYPDFACLPNYQHTVQLHDNCPQCSTFGVCIRYPST